MNVIKKILVIILTILHANGNAAEWSLNSELGASALYNDNLTLVLVNEQDSVGGSISPKMDLSMKELDQQLKVLVGVESVRYKDHPGLERDVGNFNLNWLKSTERSNLKIAGIYEKKSSLDQQLELSGLLDKQVFETTANLSSSWEYMMSENATWSLGYFFSDVHYDEPGYLSDFGYPVELDVVKVANYFNYVRHYFSIDYIQGFTEKSKVKLTVSLSDYEGEANGYRYRDEFFALIAVEKDFLEYRSNVYQLAYFFDFSNYRKISVSYGVNKTNTQKTTTPYIFDGVSGENYGPNSSLNVVSDNEKKSDILNVLYDYKKENKSLGVLLNRNIEDDVNGNIVERNKIEVKYYHNYTERLLLGIQFNLIQNKSVIESVVAPYQTNRSTVMVSPSIKWRLTKNLYFTGRYQYLERKYEGQSEKPRSNSIFIGMSWLFPGLISSY